ncbi:MAG TPA: hypothetical protein VIA82_01305 [Candidatus Limnocylindria bacterium]
MAKPDSGFWFLQILDRPELFTQARHAGEVEFMVRDLIANADEVEPDSFDLDLPLVNDRDLHVAG